MPNALIGYTGFVGSNLDKQHVFTHKYNSRNIDDITGKSFDLVVCAGIQAVKWWANQNPEEDWKGIENLLNKLRTVNADKFVLISTVDVYPKPIDVDEDSPIDKESLGAYGRHRLKVEEFVAKQFDDHLIIRLPGLFGEGLKKNVIFDLLNDKLLEKINPDSSFQYYCLDDLWPDIEIALSSELKLMNFATEPIITQEIVDAHFPGKKIGQDAGAVGRYDFRSKHSEIWGKENGYMRDKADIMKRLSQYISDSSVQLPCK